MAKHNSIFEEISAEVNRIEDEYMELATISYDEQEKEKILIIKLQEVYIKSIDNKR